MTWRGKKGKKKMEGRKERMKGERGKEKEKKRDMETESFNYFQIT